MLVNREWQDNPEMFEAVSEALYGSGELNVTAMDEVDGYGNRGTIKVVGEDGRRFRLQLVEEV